MSYKKPHYYIVIFLALFSQGIISSSLFAYESPLLATRSKAESGVIDAQLELAVAYEHGEGINKNPQKAISWYCRAALKGSVDAQRNLAWMFLNARGVDKDEALAVRWFSAAAKSGDKFSQQTLSHLDKQLKTARTVCDASATPLWESRKCTVKCRKIVKQARDIAQGYNIEPRLILAMIQQESGFRTNARSHKGAIGLMQLLPETAKRFGVKNIHNPEQNIKGGVLYLSWLLSQYRGDVALALAGYNAGEKAVDRYQGIPPYKETQNYVKRILKIYGKTYHPYEKSLTMSLQK